MVTVRVWLCVSVVRTHVTVRRVCECEQEELDDDGLDVSVSDLKLNSGSTTTDVDPLLKLEGPWGESSGGGSDRQPYGPCVWRSLRSCV